MSTLMSIPLCLPFWLIPVGLATFLTPEPQALPFLPLCLPFFLHPLSTPPFLHPPLPPAPRPPHLRTHPHRSPPQPPTVDRRDRRERSPILRRAASRASFTRRAPHTREILKTKLGSIRVHMAYCNAREGGGRLPRLHSSVIPAARRHFWRHSSPPAFPRAVHVGSLER